MVTVEDYRSGRKLENAVANSFCPIDLHYECGVKPEAQKERVVAVRWSLSSDRLANSALRVQASRMARGQAVGAAAALAVEYGVAVESVPMEVLGKALRGSGGIVPE